MAGQSRTGSGASRPTTFNSGGGGKVVDHGTYYEIQQPTDWGGAISGLASNISQMMNMYLQMQGKQKKEDVDRVEFATKFAELDPQIQTQLLQNNPQLKNYLASRAGLSRGQRKDLDTGKTEAAMPPIRDLTDLEKSKRAEAAFSATKEGELAREASSKANLQEMRTGLAAGKGGGSKTTQMAALLDLKDPVTSAMFANLDDETLTQMAELEHKVGPLYNQRNTADWFKTFLDQGIPAGQAAKYGAAVASGKLDQIPKEVLGKVGKDLALDYAKFGLEKKKFETGQQQALVQASTSLAKDAGLDPSTAMQYLKDLGAGKAPKLPGDTFAKVKAADEQYKALQIDSLKQQIANNPAAIDNITKTIDTFAKMKKEGMKPSGSMGLFSPSYDEYIQQYGEQLNKTLSKQLGIAAPQSSDWNKIMYGAVKDTFDNVVGGAGAAGAFGTGTLKDFGTAVTSPKIDVGAGQYGTGMEPGYTNPKTTPAATTAPPVIQEGALTDQQREMLRSQYQAIQQAMADPSLPAQAKSELYKHKLMIDQVVQNPSLFPALAGMGMGQQQQQFNVPPMLGMGQPMVR